MKIRIAVIALLLAVLSAGARPLPPPHRHGPPPPPPPHRQIRHYHHPELPAGAFIAGTVAGALLWAAVAPEPVPVYTTKPAYPAVIQPRYYIQNPDGTLTPVY